MKQTSFTIPFFFSNSALRFDDTQNNNVYIYPPKQKIKFLLKLKQQGNY